MLSHLRFFFYEIICLHNISFRDQVKSKRHSPSRKKTKKMEVHHHAHTRREKFCHYLYEFFMFFLAVTASFCVENLRERYVEQQRAKQFAALLINDLKKDAAFY